MTTEKMTPLEMSIQHLEKNLLIMKDMALDHFTQSQKHWKKGKEMTAKIKRVAEEIEKLKA